MAKKRRQTEMRSEPSISTPVRMLVVGVAGAAAIIGAFVLFTPLPPAGEELDEASKSLLAENGDGPPAVEPVETPEVWAARLGLPREAIKIEAAELQAELRELADGIVASPSASSELLHLAAQTYAQLKATEQAQKTWERAIEQGVAGPGVYVGLASVLAEQGEDARGIELLQSSLARGFVSDEVYLQLGEIFEVTGELDQAAATLTQGALLYPESNAMFVSLSRVQNQRGKFSEAEAAARQAIELGGEDGSILFILSMALARQGADRAEEAAEVRARLQAIRAQRPDAGGEDGFQDVYLHNLKAIARSQFLAVGEVELAGGNEVTAEKLARRCLALSPDDLKALMLLSGVYRKNQDLKSALDVQHMLVAMQPNNVLNYMNLASLLLASGQPDKAEAILMDTVQHDPEGVLAQSALARLYMSAGRFHAALPYAEHVVQMNRSVESFVLLSRVQEALGNESDAQAAVAQAKAINPNHQLLQSY